LVERQYKLSYTDANRIMIARSFPQNLSCSRFTDYTHTNLNIIIIVI
jgi:hypothetical protein